MRKFWCQHPSDDTKIENLVRILCWKTSSWMLQSNIIVLHKKKNWYIPKRQMVLGYRFGNFLYSSYWLYLKYSALNPKTAIYGHPFWSE